ARLALHPEGQQHDHPDGDRYGFREARERWPTELEATGQECPGVEEPPADRGERGKAVDPLLALDEVRERQARRRDVGNDGEAQESRMHNARTATLSESLPHSRCGLTSPPELTRAEGVSGRGASSPRARRPGRGGASPSPRRAPIARSSAPFGRAPSDKPCS